LCAQDGSECTSRNLRENHGFRGLMMDGGNSRPEINLQQEMMFSHNIVQLFKKHKVPLAGFDHLTVDIDQNTFWVALEILRGGYRPRSLAAEMNRNLAWSDSFATIDMPEEMAFFHDACGGYGCYQAPRGKLTETGDTLEHLTWKPALFAKHDITNTSAAARQSAASSSTNKQQCALA
jgi:hypothetical protein